MTRTGHTKQQQNQLKQLVFQCSMARLPSSQICKVAQEKLNMKVDDSWIRRIRKRIRDDIQDEYHMLLSDNFEYKYEFMQRIAEYKEVQRRLWELADKPHKTKEDLITLRCLYEIRESTTILHDVYYNLPGIDKFEPDIPQDLIRDEKGIRRYDDIQTKF